MHFIFIFDIYILNIYVYRSILVELKFLSLHTNKYGKEENKTYRQHKRNGKKWIERERMANES